MNYSKSCLENAHDLKPKKNDFGISVKTVTCMNDI